jgi:hypothetical protein
MAGSEISTSVYSIPPSSKRRKTDGAEMKLESGDSERKPLPVTILSGFLVRYSLSNPEAYTDDTREAERQLYYGTSCNHQTMDSESPSS